MKLIKKKKENLSEYLLNILEMVRKEMKSGLEIEYRFHPVRRWRFDMCWPDKKIALECDGMVWQAGGGRHNTDEDREKMNTAALMGWRVFRFSGKQIRSNPLGCLDLVKEALELTKISQEVGNGNGSDN